MCMQMHTKLLFQNLINDFSYTYFINFIIRLLYIALFLKEILVNKEILLSPPSVCVCVGGDYICENCSHNCITSGAIYPVR